MNDKLTRRAAIWAAAGLLLSTQTGCAVAVRVPWAKVISAIMRFVKDRRIWVLVLSGIDSEGKSVSKEITLSDGDVKPVTVTLADGSTQTITPTKVD